MTIPLQGFTSSPRRATCPSTCSSTTSRNNGGGLHVKIDIAYKFRIYPNVAQEEMLNKTFGCCRFLWNQMLAEHDDV
ncbi:helix-turn-helix domain-containing protein, partial [Candidatus Bathyarchaeota archaeon]|nr:helix-turn-helix domain-containing protein [Candidatus Bathyarchaeota archaeon]